MYSRRRWLVRALYGVTFIAAGTGMSACSRSQHCVNPESLSAGERRMRDKLQYQEKSDTPSKQCANCVFFRDEGDAAAGCGGCEILGGAVSKSGHCTSWAQ